MSRLEQGRQETERAMRRATRLADRVEQRARRQEDQTAKASERSARLAERARREEFDTDGRAKVDARKARQNAEQLKAKALEAEQLARRLESDERSGRKPSRGWGERVRVLRKHRRGGNLYRDSRRAKVLGVCAGIAEYSGFAPWQVRLAAVVGLVFAAGVTIPAYLVAFILMDDKPYYRRVTDRFDDLPKVTVDNTQTMQAAKRQFAEVEQRLRAMESHVTSSRFELQRQLKKIEAS